MLTNRHHADDVKAMAEGDGRACRRQVDSEATGARCARQEHSSACIYVALKQSKSQLILQGPKHGSATLGLHVAHWGELRIIPSPLGWG